MNPIRTTTKTVPQVATFPVPLHYISGTSTLHFRSLYRRELLEQERVFHLESLKVLKVKEDRSRKTTSRSVSTSLRCNTTETAWHFTEPNGSRAITANSTAPELHPNPTQRVGGHPREIYGPRRSHGWRSVRRYSAAPRPRRQASARALGDPRLSSAPGDVIIQESA
jgi:hypothetical protein